MWGCRWVNIKLLAIAHVAKQCDNNTLRIPGFVPPAASVFNRIEYRYTFNTFDIRPNEPVTTISNPIRPATLAAPVSHAMRWMDPAIATTTNTPTTTTQRPPRRQQSNCGQLHDQANRFAAHDGRQLLERGAWPWLAAIYATRPAGPRFQCVGTLISSTIVLTAASCMTRPAEPQQASTTDDSNMPSESNHTFFHAEELLVMLGRHNMSKWFEPGTLIRELLSLHIHPEFMNSDAVGIRQNADIAALRMRSNVEYRLFIMPVCLFATTDDDKIQPMSNGNVGFQGTVVGWGEGGHERETRLSATPAAMTLSAVHWSQCVREAGPSNAQTNDQQKRFCASIRNERSDSPCVADAGSGFIVLQHNRFALRGIMTGDGWTFLGATCSRRDYFAFTDVNRFVDWIEQFME